VLVTVVIVAAATATLSTMLSGAATAAQWHSLVGEVRHVDSIARLRARTDGPVLVSVPEGSHRLRAYLQRDARELASAALLEGIEATVIVADGSGRLLVDGGGRSADASYLLRGRGRGVRIRVSGLSGQQSATQEEPQ
jgi:hypothetical protein